MSGFDPTTPLKPVLTARCLMSLIGLLVSTAKMVPPSHDALSVSSQGALEISSVAGQPPSLDRNHFCTPRLVASSLRPQYPTLYRRLKRRLGRSLRSKFYKGSVVRVGKKATHKHSTVQGGLPGPSKLQGPVPKPNSASCNEQLNSGSLHKQTHSAKMCALLWKIMTWCHRYHITLKAKYIPGCLNVMADLLSRSNQV